LWLDRHVVEDVFRARGDQDLRVGVVAAQDGGQVGARGARGLFSLSPLLHSEFESKKALFKTWERDFATLFRRMQLYFKEQQANVRNWEKVSETVRTLYPPEQPFGVVEHLGRTTEEALKVYEAAWNQVREMMIK
jgi:hypothetical protein